MSNVEEVEAAEAKMNTAQDALLNHIEGRQAIDRDRHRRLVAQLKKGAGGFLESDFGLGRVETLATSSLPAAFFRLTPSAGRRPRQLVIRAVSKGDPTLRKNKKDGCPGNDFPLTVRL